MGTQRMAASTNLCPLSGSFSSHLSATQAMAMVVLALAAEVPGMRIAADKASRSA
jgi:hypothetical protein